MDRYTTVSYTASRLVTNAYSTSFSLSIRLFPASIRPHIYALYGLVRIADEIVDTYRGPEQEKLLDDLEQEVTRTLHAGYSANPVVHAFAHTARQYAISDELLAPFFESMRMDISPKPYDQKRYEAYIHGSAEVIGLMCLKIFSNDEATYAELAAGAAHLSAAYQKINFLRDIAADAEQLGRWYFPIGSFESFNDEMKHAIIKDIDKDLTIASSAITKLPISCRKAVTLSYAYYTKLLDQIKQTPAKQLKRQRIRVRDIEKITLLLRQYVKGRHA